MTELTSLRHATYTTIRAVVLGSSIGYGFWYVAHHANFFWLTVLALAVLVILGTLWSTHFGFDKLYRLNFLILPLVLLGSSLFFFLLLKNPSYQLFFCFIIGGLYIFFFRSFTELREHPTQERKKSVTQALDLVAALTMFLSFASLQELYFFFAWKSYWLLLAAVGLSAVLLYVIYWYNRLITFRAWFYLALGALLLGEYFWAIGFFPTGYLSSAILSVAGLFLYQSLTVASLRGFLRRRLVLEQLLLAGVISVIALLSSRWTPLQ
ncbi:MAG: hypothetical protein U0517_00020 [Candidatus Andersenbacteria bacterium]